MERDRILQEIASQLAGEHARGITFWTDEDWNRAAQEFLAGPAAHAPGATPGSLSSIAPATGSPTATTPASQRAAASAPATASVATQGTTPPDSRAVGAVKAAAAAKPLPQFGPPPPAEGRDPEWEKLLAAVDGEAQACTKCALHKTRTHVVFASGSGRIPLVFIGEGPGADEDAQGEAFVGRAGQLLTKIVAAIGLDRRNVYICNIVKCRPPGNRVPESDEAQACWPYLQRQIEILKPRVICTLGLVAAQVLLGTKAPIGKLRGRVFRYNDVPVLPTYHPAFLLRNPAMKRVVWEDVLVLRRILNEGVQVPKIDVAETPDQRPRPATTQSGDLFA